MDENEKVLIAENLELVKETGGSFMLLLKDKSGKQVGDISFSNNTDNEQIMSIAFSPEMLDRIAKTDPSWKKGVIYTIKAASKPKIDDGKGRVMELTEKQAQNLTDAGFIFYCSHHCFCYHLEHGKTWEDVEKYLKNIS